jgi:cytochrome P450
MTSTMSDEVVYDPYDPDTIRDPYATFARLRDEAPLYHNEEHGFYAVSRYADVSRVLLEKDTYISRRGVTLDMLRMGMEIPPGTLIFEDAPTHSIHRALLSRMFTPRRVSGLEEDIRRLCADLLDPFVGAGGFDFVDDYGSIVPMRVIGMLVGIPESDQQAVHDHFEHNRDSGQRDSNILSGEIFGDYIDWRVDHPSDDIMTQLLNAEFEDHTGEKKRLTRDELLAYVNIVAAAGNETTKVLIGYAGQLLAENPGERRILVEDPSLVLNGVEEILRYEPNTLQNCRWVDRDVEVHGEVVPAGSIMVTLTAAANRDPRHFDDPDRLDVRRQIDHHMSFGFGSHYCLGQALARLEGRIAIEEVLTRFPEWDLDLDRSEFAFHVDGRGWRKLPVVTR